MKNLKLNITVFVVAYLFFMIASIPAALVLGKVALPNGVKLGEVSGSLWQGQISAVQYRADVFTDVKWKLSLPSLLGGRIGADVTFGNLRKTNTVSGKGFVSSNFAMDNFSASDFVLRYPADQLMAKMKLGLPVQVSGRVLLNLNEFNQGLPYCEQLSGTVRWLKASVTMSQAVSLGTMDGELECQKGEVELKVTKPNPLGLQVTALVGANNKFSVNGFIKPNGDMPTEIHNGVRMLGQADSQGRFPINF